MKTTSLQIIHANTTLSSLQTAEKEKETIPETGKFKIKNKLIVPSTSGFQFIPFAQIESLQADGNYTQLNCLQQKRVVVSKTLKSLVGQLDDRFYRIHSSAMINLQHLQEVNRKESYVMMDSTGSYPIARSKKRQFLSQLKQMLEHE